MLAKQVKTGLTYLLILAGGLGIGWAGPQLVKAFKPGYSEGDFSAYFPDAKTNVVLYGTATCPYCAQARAYLRERNIPFADVDVNTSSKGQRDFAELGARVVPVILVGERRLTGFNRRQIDAALAEAGHPVRR